MIVKELRNHSLSQAFKNILIAKKVRDSNEKIAEQRLDSADDLVLLSKGRGWNP